MPEISCRACYVVLSALEAKGIDVEQVALGSRYTIERLTSRRGRIEWDEFVRLLDRAVALGGPEMSRAIAQGVVASPTGQLFAMLGRIAWTDDRLWRSIYPRVFASAFPHLVFRIDALSGYRFRATVEIPQEVPGSAAFLNVLAELFALGPRLLGRDAEALVEADVSAHRGVFTVTPPLSPSLAGRWLRLLSGRLFADPLLASLEEERRAFEESYQELRAVHAELARSAQALRESKLRYRELAENASDLIGEVEGAAGTIVYASPSHERVLGWTPSELVGRSVFDQLHPDDVGEVKRGFRESATEGVAIQVAFRLRHRDGSWRWFEASGRSFQSPGGALRGVVVSRDVTERKDLEERLRQSQKMEAVGRLAGGLAHDFNNLLTVIVGTAELLRSELEDPQRARVEEILSATGRATDLTRRLLALSRKQILHPTVLDLNRILEGLEKMLHRLIGEDIELELRLDRSVGPVKVDRTQIEQVVLNLVLNARDAMPEGGRLTLSTSEVEIGANAAGGAPDLAAGRYVRLAVGDTGLGMDAETRRHLFEPFFTTKGPQLGSGLGLSTAYGIVRQSGGGIRARSAPGEGSIFEVDLPRVEGSPTLGPTARAATPARGGSETLLLVEDEPEVLALTRRVLEARGYRVLTARDGKEGLAVADACEEPIDLLVTDVVMPRLGGLDLASRLRERRPGLRVLFVSGYPEDRTGAKGGLPPGTSLLLKPFTTEELSRRMRELLD